MLLADIKVMMEDMRSEIISKIDSGITETVNRVVSAVLEPIKSTIDAHGKTLADLECSANDHSSQLSELGATTTSLTASVAALSKKCEDLEGRVRMNNLGVIGLPEGSEGRDSTQVVSGLLKNLLQLDDNPMLDRAYHSLRSRPRDGDPSCPLIVRVCNLQDRDRIPRRASELSPLYHDGHRMAWLGKYLCA